MFGTKRRLREELEKQQRINHVAMSAMTDLCRERERLLREAEAQEAQLAARARENRQLREALAGMTTLKDKLRRQNQALRLDNEFLNRSNDLYAEQTGMGTTGRWTDPDVTISCRSDGSGCGI